MLPTFHLFQLLHSSTLTVFLFSQAVSCLTKKGVCLVFKLSQGMHISEKKKGSIFFLHLYYFYCSGMPRVLSQTCCLLFLTLPSGNQILYIFCGAVQREGNLLLLLVNSSSLMRTDSSEKKDGFAATALQLEHKLRLCVRSTLQETS